MLKDGMWFENKEQYAYYRRGKMEIHRLLDEMQKEVFRPLLERVTELTAQKEF